MSVKKAINRIHLWLGLASGLLVLFLGITGCILAYQREIEDLTQPYQFVSAQEAAQLAPSRLKAIADRALPGKQAHSISYEKGKASKVVYFSFAPEYYYITFLDPYNGKVLKVKDMDRDFFRIVLNGHYYLWLPPAIGQPIVASATLIFVLLLITGLVLWWPKNKAARKQRFKIKWNAKWRRTNYDLHQVLGFYMTWVVLFTAITGLIMGFQWFSKSVYWAASGGKQYEDFYEPPSDTTKLLTNTTMPAMDQLWIKMQQKHRLNGGSLEVHVPETKGTSIEVALNPDTETYWQTDYRYFDQYTLKELPVTHLYGRFTAASAADKIMRMNYDIHVGAIGGIVGKTIAFFASLLAASMPVTGFLIWWGRRNKKKKGALPEKHRQFEPANN
ncbi:PepSY-associated TM helix domain-containing protein [Pontibacter chitinilyticus]|uniref:PepSY-associated TM helix domain-containing protein n=1 Tax=Pontibacter chitinilyticus TaxID=2674989 RepID=UPI00321A4FFD